MKLAASITDVAMLLSDEVKAGEKAVQLVVGGAGATLKNAWRGQIAGADLGTRLARTIRSETYPKHKDSLNAVAMVWTRAPVIVGAHDTGPLIRAKGGLWLAIPTEAAGKGRGGKRPTPGEWEARTGLRLIFIPRRTGPSLLIAEARLSKSGRAAVSRSKTGRGLASVPIFIMVRQVSLKKRLDLDRPAKAAIAGIPGAIAARWGKP